MNGEIDKAGGEQAGDEAGCTLADLVQDPLIRLVMKSDGVDRKSIERLFARIAGSRPRAARQAAAAATLGGGSGKGGAARQSVAHLAKTASILRIISG
jgi:hypothetical protein